jgi:outer membrane protein TolC
MISTNMKRVLTYLILFGVGGIVSVNIRAESTQPATNAIVVTPALLSHLSEEMRTNNPALRAASAMTNAAAAGVAAVRTWDDPMVMAGGMAAREEMRADEGDILYGVEQKLPLFGKPRLERNVARAELAVETSRFEYEFQQRRADLAKALFRAALANRVVVIGEEDVAWLDTTRQLIESNAGVGEALIADVLQIQNERDKRANQLLTDRDQLAHEHVTLNRLLNREPQSPWPKLELPQAASAVPFNQRLIEFALKYEPQTQTMREQVRQAEGMVASVRRNRFPDITAGIEARNYSGDGSFRQGMLVFRMNLPWANNSKIRAEVRREEAKLSATQSELSENQLVIREELHQLTIKIDAARREAVLYHDLIIPRTESGLENLRTGWQSGQNSFREVLDTRRMLLDARLMYARAVAEQYEMLSELVLCCGIGDLGSLSMVGIELAPESQGK